MVENKVYEEGDLIPCGEAVVLQGEEGKYTFKCTVADLARDNTNVLRGTEAAGTTTGPDPEKNYKFYALSNGSRGIGFYYMKENGAAFESGAHMAYLAIDSETATNFIGFFDTDAITSTSSRTTDANAPAYNIAGLRVSDNYRGMVIINGVKSIRK